MRILFLPVLLAVSTVAHAGPKYDYNLEDGSKDFAELSMDVSSRVAIGKTIRISVLGSCSQPGVKADYAAGSGRNGPEFPTVMCDDKSNGHFYATGSKDLRLKLMKIGRDETVWFSGKIVGGSLSMPIIELKDK